MSQRLKRDARREEAGVSHMWQEEEPCRARREGREQNAVPVDCARWALSAAPVEVAGRRARARPGREVRAQ